MKEEREIVRRDREGVPATRPFPRPRPRGCCPERRQSAVPAAPPLTALRPAGAMRSRKGCRGLQSSYRWIRTPAAPATCEVSRETSARPRSVTSRDIRSARLECADSQLDLEGDAPLVRMPAPLALSRLRGTNALPCALLSSRAIIGIKHLPPTSHLEQQLGGFVPSRKARIQILEPLHHDLNPE